MILFKSLGVTKDFLTSGIYYLYGEVKMMDSLIFDETFVWQLGFEKFVGSY